MDLSRGDELLVQKQRQTVLCIELTQQLMCQQRCIQRWPVCL